MLGNLIIMPLRITPENMASCLKLCSIFFIMLNLVVQNNFFQEPLNLPSPPILSPTGKTRQK